MEKIAEYISINSEIRFEKPCIKGTRIAVSDILNWLSSGMSYEDILADYPALGEEHIKASLPFTN